MAGEFFIDTSAWYPILIANHASHAALAGAARSLLARHYRPVTTNLVVAETHTLLLRWEGRRRALAGLHTLGESTDVLVHSTRELESVARRDWLEPYADQDFSLADAVSFAVMRERRIEDVLTLDPHFAVAGFRVASSRA